VKRKNPIGFRTGNEAHTPLSAEELQELRKIRESLDSSTSTAADDIGNGEEESPQNRQPDLEVHGDSSPVALRPAPRGEMSASRKTLVISLFVLVSVVLFLALLQPVSEVTLLGGTEKHIWPRMVVVLHLTWLWMWVWMWAPTVMITLALSISLTAGAFLVIPLLIRRLRPARARTKSNSPPRADG